MSEMDDCCAVCAEPMDWTAYGSCGHRDVCSTCVARVRFVLQDQRCCICKTNCPSVFVTKAMGDYTRVIADFSIFPSDPVEGRNGQYWYHADTQAFFDDADQYKMVFSMCRLSCSLCDRAEQEDAAPMRRMRFNSMGHLKKHLAELHHRHMCNLCLEGRKVFICEQKLYTHRQLSQHIRSGDAEVDGTGDGFTGHPMCEFCRKPFYGENELYMHLSRDHFTCHICQRQHPENFDYFINYDDLELHFRQAHFLCENASCLEKKFVVFLSEPELKAHEFKEHGGNVPRSKRNAACQIPTSFRFRSIGGPDGRRGRAARRQYHPDTSSDESSPPISASSFTSEVAMAMPQGASVSSTEYSLQNQTPRTAMRVEFPPLVDQDNPNPRDTFVDQASFPSLSERDQSRYAQVLSQSSRGATLREESFPPLPGSNSKSSSSTQQQSLQSLAKTTFAARIQQHKAKVIYSARPRPPESPELVPSTSLAPNNWPRPDRAITSSTSTSQERLPVSKARENGVASPHLPSNSAWASGDSSRMKHSTSAPDLVNGQFPKSAVSNMRQFVRAPEMPSTSTATVPKQVDLRAANKNLVERILAALGNDEEKYSSFKSVSAEFRSGGMSASEYLSAVEQFGLSNLVLDLASCLPDGQKREELIDIYLLNMKISALEGDSASGSKESKRKKKGKGKASEHSESGTKAAPEESFLDVVRRLQQNQITEQEPEVLSKDGYRSEKGKVPVSTSASSLLAEPAMNGAAISTSVSADKNLGKDGSSSSKPKKQPKFIRSRLGDMPSSSSSSSGVPDREPVRVPEGMNIGLPARGAWRNGGGQRLFQPQKK